MCRYLYANLIRIISATISLGIAVPALLYFVLSLCLDGEFHGISFAIWITSMAFLIIMSIIVQILNKFAKRKVLFLKDKMCFGKRSMCRGDIKLRYFQFHISLIEPHLVIPKVQVCCYEKNFICYLSKNDVKKLEKMGYIIDKV